MIIFLRAAVDIVIRPAMTLHTGSRVYIGFPFR